MKVGRPKKMGRPKKENPKRHCVYVRLSLQEDLELWNLCKRFNKDKSWVMRYALKRLVLDEFTGQIDFKDC